MTYAEALALAQWLERAGRVAWLFWRDRWVVVTYDPFRRQIETAEQAHEARVELLREWGQAL